MEFKAVQILAAMRKTARNCMCVCKGNIMQGSLWGGDSESSGEGSGNRIGNGSDKSTGSGS